MAARYINTDLTLSARFNLTPLVEALETRGLICLGKPTVRGGVWSAVMETTLVHPTSERTGERLLAAIESLDGEARAAWDCCSLREFDIGFEHHPGGSSYESALKNDLLTRIAATGTSLRITIYGGPNEDND